MLSTNVAGDPSNRKKTTKGRKKIEIKKIEENNSRQVTFSKRRTGLFKKASELCVLTGAQIAILVSSPGGRVYTCGHPNVDAIIDRYLNDTAANNNNNDTVGGRHELRTPALARAEKESVEKYTQQLPARFNQHYMEVSRELEAEKRRTQIIPSSSRAVAWYNEPVDGLSVDELEQYLYSLEKLKKKVITRVDELMMIQKSPALLDPKMFEMGWNNNNTQMMNNIPTNNMVHPKMFEMGWNNNNIQMMNNIPTNNMVHPKMFEMGWNNNNIQMMNNIPTNNMVHGGFTFQHGGNVGRF